VNFSVSTVFIAQKDGELRQHDERVVSDAGDVAQNETTSMGKNCCFVGPDELPNEDAFEIQDISGLALLRLSEFWLLWGTEFVVVGVALMWKNHVGMFGFAESYTGRLVIAWVAVNAAARFGTGIVSDWLRSVFARTGYFLIGTVHAGSCIVSSCCFHLLLRM